MPLNRKQKPICSLPTYTLLTKYSAGKPSICIPAILWGLQKEEFHGDHMRTVKEDFLKANEGRKENTTNHQICLF